MSEKHETIADILDEMTRFRNGPNAKRNVSGAFVGGVLFGLANRIRAAMKREVDELQQQYDECVRDYNDAQRARSVANSEIAELKKQIGNAAKLREAVVLALSLLDLKEGVPYKTVSQKDIDFMKAVLAAHPRNCDRFGSEPEMRAAFIAYYNEAYDLKGSKYEIDTCDLKHDVDGILHEYINWLFSPEKLETKGATDGSK